MATLRQIEANRRNACKSTGPSTLAGKAVSRFNALKTGIDADSETLPHESPFELEDLTRQYDHRWQPTLPEERALVDALVHDEWEMRRLRRAKAELWKHVEHDYVLCGGRNTKSTMGAMIDEPPG